MKRLILFALAVVVMSASVVHASGKIPVFVSILPQQFVIERIGGGLVEVSVMVQPGASPATYEPSPRQMAALSSARAYFAIGVPFEHSWLDRISSANSELAMVHTDAGISKRAMAAHSHDEHGDDHGDGHKDEHQDGSLDPHVWLSPILMRQVAANTCAGLVLIDPDNRTVYEKNLNGFLSDINLLDSDIRTVLSDVPGNERTFMVFHPSWGYFADQYGLKQVAIESEGKSPGPRELVEIIANGRELGVSVLFVQPQFSDKSAKVIASELGAQVVPLDPLAKDWDENLRNAADAFRQALR